MEFFNSANSISLFLKFCLYLCNSCFIDFIISKLFSSKLFSSKLFSSKLFISFNLKSESINKISSLNSS